DQTVAMGIPNAAVAVSYHSIGAGTFPAVMPGELSFADWAMNLPAGQRGAEDSPSLDGVENAVKYLIGSDATIPDRRFLPEEDTASGVELGLAGDNGIYLTLRVRI